jgi:hypothetical protein
MTPPWGGLCKIEKGKAGFAFARRREDKSGLNLRKGENSIY